MSQLRYSSHALFYRKERRDMELMIFAPFVLFAVIVML
jgi:hypothetical protein